MSPESRHNTAPTDVSPFLGSFSKLEPKDRIRFPWAGFRGKTWALFSQLARRALLLAQAILSVLRGWAFRLPFLWVSLQPALWHLLRSVPAKGSEANRVSVFRLLGLVTFERPLRGIYPFCSSVSLIWARRVVGGRSGPIGLE